MQSLQHFLAIIFIFSVYFLNAQLPQWQHFTANDGVSKVVFQNNEIVIGYSGGLTLINKITNQKQFITTTNSDLTNAVVTDVEIDENGHLWVATKHGGIHHFDGNDWSVYGIFPDGTRLTHLENIEIGANGIIWGFRRHNNALIYLENEELKTLSNPVFWTPQPKADFTIDNEGNLWVGLEKFNNLGIGKFDGTAWTIFDKSEFGFEQFTIESLATANNGDVFISIYTGGNSFDNLLKFQGNDWELINTPFSSIDFPNSNESMTIDHNNRVWLATEDNKIHRRDGEIWTTFDLGNMGLTDGFPLKIFVDTAENWWVIYQQNSTQRTVLHQFDGQAFNLINVANSPLQHRFSINLTIDNQGFKYFSDHTNLYKFNNTEWTVIEKPEADKNLQTPLSTDAAKHLWYTTQTDKLVKYEGDEFASVIVPPNPDFPIIYNIQNVEFDQNGQYWFIFNANVVGQFDGTDWTYHTGFTWTWPNGSTAMDILKHLHIDADNNVWVLGSGLHQYDGTTWHSFDVDDAILFPFTNLISDQNGDIWTCQNDFKLIKKEDDAWFPYNLIAESNLNSAIDLPTKLAVDSENVIWAATKNGLFKYDYDNQSAQHYDIFNTDLPTHELSGIAIDESDNIWLTSAHGAIVFNENGLDFLSKNEEKLTKKMPFMQVAPNPAKDHIQINFNAVFSGDLTLFDALGKSVLVKNNLQNLYNLSLPLNLENGVYFLFLKDKSSQIYQQKLVIQR